MAEIILFRPTVFRGEARSLRPRPPLGLLYVAAPLVKNNFNVKIIDEEANSYWFEELNKELDKSTICVGVSSMTGGQILGGLRFSKIVKRRFNIPVVWGGLHASMLPEQTVKNDLVDIVVRGEGEEAFLKIANALKQHNTLKDIPSVWWKENGRIYSNTGGQFINLNNLPSLPYHLLDWEVYVKAKRSSHPNCQRVFDIHTDRGCPHRCGFCYNLNINAFSWRYFTAANVVEQIEYLVNKFSLDGINFLGDNFFVNKRRVAEICKEIIKRNIKVTWHADCRIDYFVKYDDSFISLLKQSGCRLLTFGIESGSQRILDLINKDLKIDDIFKVNEKLKKWRMGVGYHFMAGFPEETRDDVLHTYKMMMKLFSSYPRANFLGPSVYTPYPGTPLYDKCLEMGFVPPHQLDDWANFGWDEKTSLPFIKPEYSKWLIKSINVIEGANIIKRASGLDWLGWWFWLRTKIIVKFNVIGPQIEQLVYIAQIIIAFVKNRFKYQEKSKLYAKKL